jgi:hypothetical protein
MDRDVDRAEALIARNRLLLALAKEAGAWTRDAIAQAKEVVESTTERRLAWARVRQRWDDPPRPPELRL